MLPDNLADRARRFALPVLLLLLVAAGAYFFLVYQAPESLGDLETHLKDAGKVLVVGEDDLARLKAPGATLVPSSSERELARLLDRRDEAALIRALEAKGFRAILADTSLARPERLPRVTLRNTLSLYRPLEHFTATYLTERAALYTWHDPFVVSDADAARLIAIARHVLATGEAPPSAHESEALRRRRASEVSVVLRGQGPALIWRSARRDTLLQSVVDAANVVRDRWEVRQERRHGPLPAALERLALEIEIFHDHGLLGDRSLAFVQRAIEPGIYGAILEQPKKYRYMLPSTSVYASRESVEDYLATVSKEADLGEDGWSRSDVKLTRFRTLHFREARPGGPVVRLYRGIPPVGDEVQNRAAYTKALALAADWLVDNQKPDGQYLYSYFPERDRDPEQRNIVRHGLAAYGLAMAYEYDHRESTRAAAERGLELMLENTRWGEGPPAPNGSTGPSDEWEGKRIPRGMAYVRYVDADQNGPIGKMGTVAAAVFTITQLAAVTGQMPPEWRRALDGYGEFLLFMQKDDGSFHHYYCTSDHSYYGQETTIYPGEILLALSRIYGVTGDEKYAASFERGTRFYDRWWKNVSQQRLPDGTYSDPVRIDLVQFVPWISMAMSDMVPRLLDRKPALAREYARFGIDASAWIAEEYQFDDARAFFPDYLGGYYKMATELPAMHGCVYTEGTAAAYHLAVLMRDRRRAMLHRATLLGCRFAIQQLVTPGVSDFWMPNPRIARGGVRYSLNGNKLRIDYSYHSMSAIYQALKYMPASDLPP